jgi:hypothetical protein
MSKNAKKRVSETVLSQITVLKTLSKDPTGKNPVGLSMEIDRIIEKSGLGDEKEVLRYLYILEGQKLVNPVPEGDFTSKIWKITSEGLRALKVYNDTTTTH